jgi:hypothetical protein
VTPRSATRRAPVPPVVLPDLEHIVDFPDPTVEVGSLLRSLLRGCRLVPVADPTGQGLVSLALDPAATSLPRIQELPIADLLPGAVLDGTEPGTPVRLIGLPPPLDQVGTFAVPTHQLRTVIDALGVELAVGWPQQRPKPTTGPAAPVGALVPLVGAETAGTGAAGLLGSLLPVPPLTSIPGTYTVDAVAQVGLAALVDPLAEAVAGLVDLPELPNPQLVRLPLELPTLVVPPILALFTGPEYTGDVLVLTPLDLGPTADGLLDLCADLLRRLDVILRLAPLEAITELFVDAGLPVPPYVPVALALRALIPHISGANVRVLSSRSERDLNEFDLRAGFLNDVEADNVFSSFFYVGLPGPAIDLYSRRDHQGARVRIGIPDQLAQKGQLAVSHPRLRDVAAANPAGGILEVQRGNGDDTLVLGFNNRASSFRFRGVPETPLDAAVGRLRGQLGV